MKYLILIFSLFQTSCTLLRGSQYEGPRTENFNGEVFENHVPDSEKKSFWRYLKMRMRESYPDWPKTFPAVTKTIPQSHHDAKVTFINHATVLIQLDKMNILTDPVWSKRASPFSFTGPKRVIEAGVDFDKLPRIDVVLISHDHYDHLDEMSIKMLEQRDRPLFLVGLGNELLLKDLGVSNVVSLDWWQEYKMAEVTFTFTPAQHWSGRGLFDRNTTLWGSFWIKGSKSVYFGGDTGLGPHFKMIHDKLGAPDLALLPIGAYEPRSFMKHQHMNPTEAVNAHMTLESKKSVGIHFGTFRLTKEDYFDPEKHLKAALKEQAIDESLFIAPKQGEELIFVE
ncbi:beta-lactamase family protein [Bacteriovorax sp. BSW11_IV]|uniref:MBL fold metallo-hydrolase n=1 Tax=Bacteriovorax sp. BSW11_IV TaxID=1353529 RepID=UPI00038A3320|nr:MBL fold metallo-hydrolase [Bacteriovorax sp. BSW11_IV]EQC48872.1 beta-lactamase family protein [Bacteriovorax sp. BSW11_IV]